MKSNHDSLENLRCELQVIATATEYGAARIQWLEFLQRPNIVAGFFTDPHEVEQRFNLNHGDFLLLGNVVRGGDLVALVPLVCHKTHAAIRYGLLTLARISVRVARIPDLEFPREHNTCVFQAFAAVLKACSAHRHLADLATVDCAPAPPGGQKEFGFRLQNVQTAYTIPIRGDFEAYLQTMSAKSRQTIKRKIRKFEKAAGQGVHVGVFRSPLEMENLHEALTVIWKKSWHGRLERQHVPSADYLKQMARNGWIRAYVLLVKERPVASILGFQYRGTYYYEAPAYDHDWQEHSPGIVLLYNALKDLFEVDSPVKFDFGAGYGQYKQVFGTHHELRGGLCVGFTMRGKAVMALQTTANALFRCCKTALDRTGIPHLIKRKLREGA